MDIAAAAIAVEKEPSFAGQGLLHRGLADKSSIGWPLDDKRSVLPIYNVSD